MLRVQVDDQVVAAVLAAHDAGQSTLAVAKTYGLSPKVTRRILREHARTVGKLPRVRPDLFTPPLTAADAYWLGFLVADGYVNTARGFARLKLSDTDQAHMTAFAAYAGLPTTAVRHEVNSSTGNAQAYVDLTGRQIINRLVGIGVTQGKPTRRVVVTDDTLVRHYMRGLVDADGCISGQRLSICCTTAHAQWVSAQLTRVFALPPRRAYEHMGIKRVYIPKTVTPKVLAWLYDNIPTNTALPRKLAAAKALMNKE